MLKTSVSCSYCLLGIGYTSIIASHLLKEKGIDSIIVGVSNERTVFDLKLSNYSISPLPIFPVKDSYLFQTLKLSDLFSLTVVDVSYSEIRNCDLSKYKFTRNSLAEFIYRDSSNIDAFVLGLKQWGASMLEKPFSEVQNKIKRQYLSGSCNSRVGYSNGFTLYYHFIKNSFANVLHFESIKRIDYTNKIILTNNNEIHYEKLISTIPLDQLLSYCKMKAILPISYEGSYFFYFSHDSEFKANSIIYDCDLFSDIIRVFSVTDRIILVQLPGYKKGKIRTKDIEQRLHELIPTLKKLNFEKELFRSISYPIESITDSKTIESIQMLSKNSIVTFGRFGNWEYLDLHELDWNSIL